MNWQKDYSLTADFLNATVFNHAAFAQEVRNQSPPIDTVYAGATDAGDTITVTFASQPSTEGETALDSAVAAHTGAPLPASAISTKSVYTDALDPAKAKTTEQAFQIVPAEGADLTTYLLSFDVAIDLLHGSGYFNSASCADGDRLAVWGRVKANGGVIGVVRAVSAAGQKVLQVDDSVAAYVGKNQWVEVGGKKYRVTTKDTSQGVATLTLDEDLDAQAEVNDMVVWLIPFICGSGPLDGDLRKGRYILRGSYTEIGSAIREQPVSIPDTVEIVIEYSHATTPGPSPAPIDFSVAYRYEP